MIKRFKPTKLFLLRMIPLILVATIFILTISLGFADPNSGPTGSMVLSTGSVSCISFDEENVDVIVTFSENVDFSARFPQAQVHHTYQALNGVAATIPYRLYEVLQNFPFVTSVELDRKVQVLLQADTLDWGIDKIDAELVWGGDEDDTNVDFSGDYAGQGIKVAIFDTGIDTNHPDLDDNWKGGWNFVDNNNNVTDLNGHGTHVAGIIAAEDNEEGVIGVAPKAEIYAVKIMDLEGIIIISDLCAAFDWAINESHRMDVISISLGYLTSIDAVKPYIDAAYAAGIVIVAASGNDNGHGHPRSTVQFPAREESVIAVGAVTSTDDLASFSHYGVHQELVAPGVDINSTMPTYEVQLNGFPDYLDNDYDEMSGTSMACPMVSGTVALMLSGDDTLTPPQIREILSDTALDINATGWDIYTGNGRVQAEEAFKDVLEDLIVHPDSYISYRIFEDRWYLSSHMRIDNDVDTGIFYVKIQYKIGDYGTWWTIREENKDLSTGTTWIDDNDFRGVGLRTKVWVRWTVGFSTRSEYKITPPRWP